MTNMNPEKGRTLFDFLSEKPIFASFLGVFVVVLFLLIASGFLFGNLSLKIGGIEINKKKCIHDTIYMHKQDTIRIEKLVFVEKKPVADKKQMIVKKGDTTIVLTNQPSNVNIGGNQNVVHDNNGIIGNNNQINVNAEPQRHLDSQGKLKLIELIEQNFIEKKKDKKCPIAVSSVGGNSEAYNFANEIVSFLIQQNYNTSKSIGQFQSSPVIKGVEVRFGVGPQKDCLQIEVGIK